MHHLANLVMSNKYQLLRAGAWIRILRLEPACGTDWIKCSLCPLLLDDILSQYDTFSHAWGIENPTHIIQVDDGALAMIENLFKVLATLWAEDETLDLWADAICIDQDSTAEKNLQLRQM